MFHKFFLLSTLFLALTGCAGQGDNSRGLPGWAILLLLVALIVVVWLIIRVGRIKAEEPELTEPEAEKVIAHQPIEPDDLALIEGIGPKTQSILQAAGIQTFAQLADLAPEKIKELLTESGLRLGVTDTLAETSRSCRAGEDGRAQSLAR